MVAARDTYTLLHLIYDSLDQSEPTTQTVSPPFRLFCADDRRVSIYFTMGRPSHSKLPFPTWDVDLYLIHGSLSPPESSTQTASRSVQPFLHGSSLWQTNTPRYTRSVTAGRIYTYVILRCSLKIHVLLRCQLLCRTITMQSMAANGRSKTYEYSSVELVVKR